MKKTFQLILIFLCPLFAMAKGFTITGSVQGLQSGTVTLAYINQAGEDTTLTSTITGGAFTFAGITPEPQLVRLTITEGWPYNTSFFLENAAINIKLVKDAPEKTTITGSVSEMVYEKLEPGLSVFFENARQSKAAHQQAAATHNLRALQAADSVWFAQQGQWIQHIRNTNAPHTDNYAALYFIRWLLFKPDNYDAIFAAYKELSPTVKQSMAGKKLLTDLEHLHRTLPGQPAAEITGKDTLGRPVTLAAFKGKVLLLDFWASYCGPCRQENRNMQPVYQKCHAAGFEIVSLSLDDARHAWTQAILADGMTWPQLSELRGGASASAGVYDVSDLPRNVLIDRSGKIYAKDLHGEDLVGAIESLLAKGK